LISLALKAHNARDNRLALRDADLTFVLFKTRNEREGIRFAYCQTLSKVDFTYLSISLRRLVDLFFATERGQSDLLQPSGTLLFSAVARLATLLQDLLSPVKGSRQKTDK
jgi:hypothetical protein